MTPSLTDLCRVYVFPVLLCQASLWKSQPLIFCSWKCRDGFCCLAKVPFRISWKVVGSWMLARFMMHISLHPQLNSWSSGLQNVCDQWVSISIGSTLCGILDSSCAKIARCCLETFEVEFFGQAMLWSYWVADEAKLDRC